MPFRRVIRRKWRRKMSALIEEFKREHAKIIAMLKEVKELGILSKEGQARLMSIEAH
jgi:hypothetical protein